jgi:hypothetical protein
MVRFDDEFSVRDYRREHRDDAWMRRQDVAVDERVRVAHPNIDAAERARLQRRLMRRNTVINKRQGGYVDSLELLVIAVIVVVCFGVLAIAIAEAKQWSAFKQERNCKVVAKINGDVFTAFGTDGKATVGSTSGKTGWLCDDGITYYR